MYSHGHLRLYGHIHKLLNHENNTIIEEFLNENNVISFFYNQLFTFILLIK